MTKKKVTARSSDVIMRAVELHRQGEFSQAEDLYHSILEVEPDNFDARHMLGVTLLQRGQGAAAIKHIQAALKIRPNSILALNNLGNALKSEGLLEESLKKYEETLRLAPSLVETWINRSLVLMSLRRLREAVMGFNEALILSPESVNALLGRAMAYRMLRRYDEALRDVDLALTLSASNAPVFEIRARVLKEMGKFEEALLWYDRCLREYPSYGEVYFNRANLLREMGMLDTALSDYAKAISLLDDPSSVKGIHLYTKMLMCDWDGHKELVKDLRRSIQKGKCLISPFSMLSFSDAAEDQLICAREYVKKYHPACYPQEEIKHLSCQKVRIAYLSSDFHEHATAYLTAGLFEEHDRSQFEALAFSLGINDRSAMRQRLVNAFDDFIDVSLEDDNKIAEIIKEKSIDILIDLKGFTYGARPDILARKPAPIQVNFLGYPGTMGAPYIDYIIADSVIINHELEKNFSEKVVYLPGSYQVNDNKRYVENKTPSKEELRLPEQGVIFCCFNNSYKITPDMFDVWMRLLTSVNGSVLWLLEDNLHAKKNLCKEAEIRGVNSGRLIFAPRVPVSEHLARQRQGDLFLDTLPCNAHTTASDALWVGVPLLTCVGQTFAGRVAASLLTSVGVPELITHSLKEYEEVALTLATHPQQLKNLKEKLERNRSTCRLFDTKRYTRDLEEAFREMIRLYKLGSPPQPIKVGYSQNK